MITDESVTGILQPETSFEGKITFSGTFKIGGYFKGEVISGGTLIIDEGARVEANINVGEVVLKGQLSGHVVAEKRIVMLAPAKFKGTVSSPNLKIEEGVHFEGESSPPRGH
ncbi:MAG: polymer-forming cytoskeletal protein [Bdellovibrionales bacterium]|nr:polymer-forming cytoskeletal protein [Bdellovibrionales bacterium]